MDKPVSNTLLFIWDCLRWCFWKYLAFICLTISMPMWPWIIYMLYHNENNENGACLINWHRKPRKGNHLEELLYAPVECLKDIFDFGIDCVCHE